MSRKNFHRLLQRYLDGQCTPEEAKLVDHWYHMLEGQHDGKITPDNLDAVEESIWDKIHGQINDGPAPSLQAPKRLRRRSARIWIVAASVAVFLVAGATFIYYRIACYPVKPSFAETSLASEDVVRIRNNQQDTLRLVLPDKSVVKLYPGASLSYPSHFKTHREVQLIGNAFFMVEANPKNPFWVFHEGMITKVTGTTFEIMAPNGETMGEVIVYTGTVDVFYNVGTRNLVKRVLSAPERTSITPNKRAVLLPQSIEETLTENPYPIKEKADALKNEMFKDISMPALATTLSELYALDVVADESLAGVTFTGDISGIGLFKQLDIICTVTNTNYEVVGTTIVLRQKH